MQTRGVGPYNLGWARILCSWEAAEVYSVRGDNSSIALIFHVYQRDTRAVSPSRGFI